MINNEVPFFYDDYDGWTCCYQTVLKMILKYFIPEKNYSWEDLFNLTNKKDGRWSWPFYSYISMNMLGFKLKIISLFDYEEFSKNGLNYLEQNYGSEFAKQQKNHSDIELEIEHISNFKNIVEIENRQPQIYDIKKLLSEGYILECIIDFNHSILVYGFKNNTLFIHNPCGPQGESMEQNVDVFYQEWAYPNDNAKSITAFKLI